MGFHLSGLPPEIIFPLTAIARAQGYMARWREFNSESIIPFSLQTDPSRNVNDFLVVNSPPIWRPQQIYTGPVATNSSKL